MRWTIEEIKKEPLETIIIKGKCPVCGNDKIQKAITESVITNPNTYGTAHYRTQTRLTYIHCKHCRILFEEEE